MQVILRRPASVVLRAATGWTGSRASSQTGSHALPSVRSITTACDSSPASMLSVFRICLSLPAVNYPRIPPRLGGVVVITLSYESAPSGSFLAWGVDTQPAQLFILPFGLASK